MNKIEIYTTTTCPYCAKAKKLLAMVKLEYIEHNVDGSFDEMIRILDEKYNQKGVATVPQIVINEKYVGGCDDLEKLIKSGVIREFLVPKT